MKLLFVMFVDFPDVGFVYLLKTLIMKTVFELELRPFGFDYMFMISKEANYTFIETNIKFTL